MKKILTPYIFKECFISKKYSYIVILAMSYSTLVFLDYRFVNPLKNRTDRSNIQANRSPS